MEKKQLQQMLREMGVAYPADATPETLAEILKEENHRQWLKSSAARIVRKRREGAAPSTEKPKPHPPRRPGAKPTAPARKPIQRLGRAPDRHTAGERAAQAADASSVTACDLCEASGRELSTYAISDKPGSRHRTFLCAECLSRVRRLVTDRELKILKRKARRRAEIEVRVDYGKVEHTWGYKPEE
jgi:uncharacterized protein YlaI